MPTYKHNRTGGRKPITYKPLREYVADTYETFIRPTLEGDDVLGILATSKKLVEGEKIVVAIDKDLRSIPGLLYNPNKPTEGIVTISQAQADWFHLFQTLTGDVTDGYPGCPRIGPKKAEAILAPFLSDDRMDVQGAWPEIVKAYENAGQMEGHALMNARVARILRASDYDFKNKQVKLWNP
jgi:DNA polymerase-1